VIIEMTPQEIADFESDWLEPFRAEDVLPNACDRATVYQPKFAPPVSTETELVFEHNGKTYSVLGRIRDVKYTCHNGVESTSRLCRCTRCTEERSGSNEPGQEGVASERT